MRHHYAPEFLQKPWSDSSANGKLVTFRLDLPHIPSSQHTPKHTGFEPNLWALTKDNIGEMDKQVIEELLFKSIDNDAARVRNKLETSGLKSLTVADRMDWARFLMSLRLRQPDIVGMLKQDSAELLKATLNDQPTEYEELAAADDDALTLAEWTEKQYPGLIDNFGLTFFHELVDNPFIGNKILAMKWWLWDFSKSPHDLLLSDHPCIFTSGIDRPNCAIALPIHPKKAFLATQNDQVAEILRRQSPKDLAACINESSVNQSRVRIYARNEAPRRFIENRISSKIPSKQIMAQPKNCN